MSYMTSDQRVVVTGAGGFLGTHVCRRLVARSERVTDIDNLSTGYLDNLASLAGQPGFEFLCADVTEPLALDGRVRAVVHLACPASQVAFIAMPLATLRAVSIGTLNALDLARAKDRGSPRPGPENCSAAPSTTPAPRATLAGSRHPAARRGAAVYRWVQAGQPDRARR